MEEGGDSLNMRKAKYLVVILAVLLLFLTSCATTLRVRYRVPSEIDMGRHRNIAVTNTIPYRYFAAPGRYVPARDRLSSLDHGYVPSTYDQSLSSKVASYATDTILRTLDRTGYFTSIMLPMQTELIMRSKNRTELFESYGVDAIIVPQIESMSVDEYIMSESASRSVFNDRGEPRVVRDVDYHYVRDSYLVFSVYVIDAKTERLIGAMRFPDESHQSTLIGSFLYTDEPYTDFTDMISDFQWEIVHKLVPTLTYRDISLMSNKPKAERIEIAYDMVKDELYQDARNIFLLEFQSSAHLPSGYNASLLSAALGDIDSAITIIEDVIEFHPESREANALYSTLLSIRRSNEEALRQIEGTGSDDVGVENSVLDMLLMET